MPPDEIPRAKVNQGATSAADVNIYAWRNEKLLGKWNVGRVEGLGLTGLKSHDVALLRQAAWAVKRGTS